MKSDLKKRLEEMRGKPVYFECAICERPIKNQDDIIDVVLSNPRKIEEPKWQQFWICKKCCKETFKLGRNLVILEEMGEAS